jgi:hypothetical protein
MNKRDQTLTNLGFLGCNLLVLWINVKLYTEILKDQSVARRIKEKVEGH